PDKGEGHVPIYQDLTLVFSKPQNESTVTWNISQGMALAGSWSNGSTRLVLAHAEPFIECANYDIEVDGYDWQGLRLAPPKVWFFSAVCYRPYIVSTAPEDGVVQVPLNETIVVEFSETINETTLEWDINPDPGGWVLEWNWNSSIAYFNHSVNFTECLEYDVEMISFKDMDDRLMKPGRVPNPWGFMSQCGNPYIVSTDPDHLQEEVPFDYPLTVVFSEPMTTDTVAWSLDPNYWPPDTIVFTVQWFDNDTRAVFSHVMDFHVCQEYSFWISSAADKDYDQLVPGPVPNPFNFTTDCPNPYIILEAPSNGEVDVTLTVHIEIRFSETMNKNSFAWTITPDPGGWSQYWNMSDTRVLLSHSNLFGHCTLYEVEVIYVEDVDGNPLVPGPYPLNETHPNPWTFKTYCDAPFIVSTSPSDMEQGVPTNVSVLITFSEAIDPSTFLFTVPPTLGGWETDWMTMSEVYLNRSHDLPECTSETIHVTQATDLEAKHLVPGPVPNPWTFKTVCPNPQILLTNPSDGEGGVSLDAPLVVVFDRPMDQTTLDWTLNPDPGGWTVVWEGNFTVLTLTHSNLFTIDTVYEAEVVSILDMEGNPLVPGPVPNPWQFTTGETVSAPTNLQVRRTFPDDVTIVWDLVGGATSYHVYSTTDRFEPWPWANMIDVAAPATTAILAGHLSDGLDHYYIVRAYNDVLGKESGNSTMGAKLNRNFVASPMASSIYWMSIPYRSIYTSASDVANELTQSKVNVIAKWDREKQEMTSYYFARGKWRGRDFTLSPGDGFYVSAVSDFAWYINGTDFGTSLDFGFMPSPTKTNAHWISLAPTSVYAKASDIVIDIEGGLGPGTNTKIVEVRKWDPSTSTEIVFHYDGTGWTGIDFDISGADGVCLQVVSSFSWSPRLLTPAVD
ncbi:MAG: Ig-like domain-containing protein, partial [Candidatus Thermoplasmatota archaeon]|nr:Ig-like domain-containing protein [Candidatus Thermoplasmatota archaeon]